MSEAKVRSEQDLRAEKAARAIQARVAALKAEQNLAAGLLGGVVGGLIGAVLWALITNLTDYQIGWMAVGIGFLVGLGVRTLGKGIDTIFGIMGGAVSLISVIVGNFLAAISFLAEAFELSYFNALFRFNYSLIFDLLFETFSPIDVLFYIIAVYTGYRFSFQKITKQDLLEGLTDQLQGSDPEAGIS